MVSENDDVALLENTEDQENGGTSAVDIEMQEVHNIQADLSHMQSRLWNSEEMTEEEAEEVERQSNLLKIKLAQTSEKVRMWGMQTGLERLLQAENVHKWHEDKSAPVDEYKVLATLLPIAFLFMALVLGASTIHFDESVPIPGNLWPLTPEYPIIMSMAEHSTMMETRLQIQSVNPADAGGHGHHRRFSTARNWLPADFHNKLSSDPTLWDRRTDLDGHADSDNGEPEGDAVPSHGSSDPAEATQSPEEHGSSDDGSTSDPTSDGHGSSDKGESGDEGGSGAHGEHETSGHGGHGDDAHGEHDEHDEPGPVVVEVWLFTMKNGSCTGMTRADFMAKAIEKESLGNYSIKHEEQALLTEFEIAEDPHYQCYVIFSMQEEPLAVAIAMHSLGSLGPSQVVISGLIMCIVFGLIMTEVMHRTMAAMIGATLCMITLAMQNRVPSLSKTVAWMDHGTLGLLWGMMLIVGITMRTGVFEWTGVLACKLSGGNKTKLLFLLCLVTAVLSAFLDNVTTILLIAPVTCKLCKLVSIDPRPFLICEAIFSNIGGTATMIGDPPNIIIGNMLAQYLDFNDFLFNLGPGVILASPPAFYALTWYFKDAVSGNLVVDIPKLQKMYPITDRALLIKCGVVLSCVIASFFLHPVTHLDPAWVAIMGAVWLLVAFDMHHCHEALLGVEWDTLLFFAALFVVVEGVGELGLLRFIANTLSGMVSLVSPGGRQAFSIFLICWSSAIFSAFVDNIPFTATMVPVMQKMVEDVAGINIEPLAWALAFGACFGGNGTLIGASANIVMASKAEVEGWHISFMDFFKVGFPIMILTVAIATVYLLLLNAIFWQSAVAL